MKLEVTILKENDKGSGTNNFSVDKKICTT